MQKLQLSHFGLAKLSEPKKIGQSPDGRFEVEVNSPRAFNYVISTHLESHRIKKFALLLE